MDIKPALVFVHGYLGGSKQWTQQVSSFAEDFEVITSDLPGFGLNNQLDAPQSIAGFADYVLENLQDQGIQQFDLIGHSMGGMIAQEMVHRAPQRVKKLILYGTGPIGVMPGRFETIEVSKQRLRDEGVEKSARRISAKWLVEREAALAYADCASIAIQASEQAALAGLTAMQNWSGKEYLAQINLPTLVLWGDQDQSYQWEMPETLWREIPNANLSVVAGCSHAVHLEKPQLFNAIIRDFLI